MKTRDYVYDPIASAHDMLAADAPAIPAMLSFYNDMLKGKVAVFFITGREEKFRDATEKNLTSAGYHHWQGLYLRPNKRHYTSMSQFKSQKRADITEKGYTIIATLGDQNSDLTGGYAERGFKLPNPYYYLP
jgi:predicted secreted acid phosphatase